MRTVLAVFAALLVSANVQAQTPIVIGPTSVIEWTMPTTPAPGGLIYGLVVDTAAPLILTGFTCGVAGAPTGFNICTVPAVGRAPIGAHTLTMTASDGVTTSLPSAPYSYLTLVIPVPSGLRIR